MVFHDKAMILVLWKVLPLPYRELSGKLNNLFSMAPPLLSSFDY